MDKLLKNNWRYYALIFCGILLVANTWSLNHEPLRVVVSDTLAGIFVALLSIAALVSKKRGIDWALTLLAAYLMIAPILLWANTPSTYLNDNLIGAIIFALAIFFAPEEINVDYRGSVPLGWSYNPSKSSQRLPVITLAFLAYLFSRYMAFYQLGYIQEIVDPVFVNGTHSVITSNISKAFPVSDAGLGSWVYAIEVLMGIHGSKKRWHTIPWFVTFFAILVIPAGLVSVILITLQPLVVGAYCFWCLITALCMLFMIALAADEVVATILYLGSVRRRGGDVKKAFWEGDPYFETENDRDEILSFGKPFWGLSFPWTLVLSILIGFWMMFFKDAEIADAQIRSFESVVGALIITFSVISFGEVIRSLRFVNIFLGIMVALFALDSQGAFGVVFHLVLGLIIIILTIPRGTIRFSYGEWNKYIV